MTREDCLLLGTIAKTRGIRGELVLRVKDPTFEPDDNWESLFLQIDGILVPFFISALHPVNKDEWFISFDDYDRREKVMNFIGREVWIRKDLLEAEENPLFLDELIGFHLTNIRNGKVGIITGLIDIAGNPLFEVYIEDEKLMIPAQEKLVAELDREHSNLLMNLPEGMM
jgi:16S rRNA processing protein RimM